MNPSPDPEDQRRQDAIIITGVIMTVMASTSILPSRRGSHVPLLGFFLFFFCY